MKAEGRDDSKDMKAEGRERPQRHEGGGPRGSQRQDEREVQERCGEPQTIGQAGAGAKLSTEQRTKITTVIQGAARSTGHQRQLLDLGRHPRSARRAFHPLPAEIVTYYPEWRGYEFILVGDQIVVVDPAHARDRGRARRLSVLQRDQMQRRGGQQCPPLCLCDIRVAPAAARRSAGQSLTLVNE